MSSNHLHLEIEVVGTGDFLVVSFLTAKVSIRRKYSYLRNACEIFSLVLPSGKDVED